VEDRDGLINLARRMEDKVGTAFEFEQRPIPLRTSIGVALYPDDGYTLEALLETADQAMYVQKRSRSGTRQ
jgi:GGDEF domain-containing protein